MNHGNIFGLIKNKATTFFLKKQETRSLIKYMTSSFFKSKDQVVYLIVYIYIYSMYVYSYIIYIVNMYDYIYIGISLYIPLIHLDPIYAGLKCLIRGNLTPPQGSRT